MISSSGIVCQNLSKKYSGAKDYALKDLTLDIRPGEVYGFLGPNGAGKSTTIRLLMNFIQPTSGQAKINDLDVAKNSILIKKSVGYLAGDIALYEKATGKELLDYLFKLQGVKDHSYRTELEKRFSVEVDKPIKDLSKGNKQKIGIVQAFMHKPNVLILDEPTSGLDPLMQEVFHATINEARERGAAILMSSHNLSEAQRVSDRVGIIKNGQLIREESVIGNSDFTKPIFRIALADAKQMSKLRNASNIKFIKQESSKIGLIQPKKQLNAMLKDLSSLSITEITSHQFNLEDEFLELYGGQDA